MANKKKKKKVTKVVSPKKKGGINKWSLLILVLTAAVFSPVLKNEFVNWDDDRNIYDNETVLNLNWETTQELFTSTVIGNYNPLSNFLLGVQHQLFEGSDQYHMWFHFTNLLLHLLCVFVVWKLGQSLGLRQRATIILTLLFALHPMRVESVAWITEIKDVLYASFFLGGLYLYASADPQKKGRFQPMVFLLFFIGLFAKIQMVAFPLALVCIDYWKGEKNLIKSAIRHWPYFLGALAFGIIGIFALKGDGSLETNNTFNLFQRVFIGAYSWCVYLIKSIVPYRLSPLYPYPPVLSVWHYISILPFLGSLGAMFWFWNKDKKVLFFGTAFFFFNIVFLLQILGAGQGYLADRFTYVAYWGLFFIYAYYLDQWMDLGRVKKFLPWAVAAVVLFYAGQTYAQTKIWQNSETLWTHVLKYYKTSTLPYGNRANHFRDTGQREKALADYSASIKLKSDNPAPFNSRAKLYFSMNKDQEAMRDYQRAIALDPDNAEYVVNLGASYAKMGQWDQAIAQLSRGLELEPNNTNALLNRSLVWQELRRYDQTLKDLLRYLEIKPNDANIWYEAGRVQRVLGKDPEAMRSYNRAISLNDQNGLFFAERSKLHYKNGAFQNAGQDIRRAQQLGAKVDPALVEGIRSNGG